MTVNDKYQPLFEPMKIGPQTLRNRFYKAPHCTSFGSDRPGTQAYFRATAAEGGWAAVNTEVCSVHPSSDDTPLIMARLWDDHDIRNLSLMTERVHEHGALAGVELWYGSAHTANLETRVPPGGVSQIPCEWGLVQACYELTKDEIRELRGHYVSAAVRARAAGFDLINVYGGHGGPITYHFLDEFWNKRTDEYGGSFENRARFWREVIEEVKEAVGDTCAIVVRASLDSLREGGPTVDDTIRFIEHVDHLVDLWDFQLGAVNSEWGDDSLSSRLGDENFQRPWLEKVRPHTDKPIVGVGRFVSPDVMLDMVASGTIDIVGSARGSIADPFIPNKIAEGRLDEIRECIGCNMCVSRVTRVSPLICTQNATAGEEYRRGWHPERFDRADNADKDVVVIGAGPAGMECAIVLGKRGMRRVHLIDGEPELGGHLRWVSQLPGLGQWARVINWREIQLAKLPNVEVIPQKRISPEELLEYGAELVVVATGATWVGDGLSGATHAPVPGADASLPGIFTPEQIMVEGKPIPGPRVLIYDCDGYFMGLGLAERLTLEGRSVTWVTPHSQPAAYTFFTLEGPRIMRRVRSLGIETITEHVVTEISDGVVRAVDAYDANARSAWEVDAVVLVTQRRSEDSLYRSLVESPGQLAEAGIEGIYRIGDALAPRFIADAVFDGHRLGREIDSDNPAEALPFIRENRVIGASDMSYDATLQRRGTSGTLPSSVLAGVAGRPSAG